MISSPSSSVWYIHASSRSETGQGSGVGVRLRRKGQRGAEETYLLTCAHVVRRPGGHAGELGPRHDKIWVLPAGFGYDPTKGIPASIVDTVTPLGASVVAGFYDQPVADVENADWVLLAFRDAKWQNCHDADKIAGRWPERELSLGDDCVIAGYPDGQAGFSGHDNGNDNIVRPKPGYAAQTVEKVVNGVVTFDGLHSRAGMSGGGVFRNDGDRDIFSGLHRARFDSTLQLKAVSALSILQRLDELGYEPVEFNKRTKNTTFKRIGVAAALVLAMLAIWPWLPTLRKGIFSADGGKASQPEQVEITLRDAATGEQIRREFEIFVQDQTIRSDGFRCEVNARDWRRDAELSVACLGYKPQPLANRGLLVDAALTAESHLFLVRDDEYMSTIEIPGTVALPSNAQITAARADNRVPPADVTLLILNDTGHAPDIILELLETERRPENMGLFRGWVDASNIRPEGWSDPKFPFDAVNAVWAVYVSFEGQPARLVQSLALYQDRFVVLHLKSYRGRELDAEFKFYDSDPRITASLGHSQEVRRTSSPSH